MLPLCDVRPLNTASLFCLGLLQGPSLCFAEGHLAGGRSSRAEQPPEYRAAKLLVQAVREGDIARAYTRLDPLVCAACGQRITSEEWWHCLWM